MNDIDIAAFLQAQGEDAQRQFDVTLRDLQNRVIAWDPFQLLATFSYYGLTTAAHHQQNEWASECPILQHHVELLQALTLQHPETEFDHHALPADLAVCHNLLRECTQAYLRRRQVDIDPTSSDAERHLRWVQYILRGHTLAVRNWGYMEQVVRLLDLLPKNSTR